MIRQGRITAIEQVSRWSKHDPVQIAHVAIDGSTFELQGLAPQQGVFGPAMPSAVDAETVATLHVGDEVLIQLNEQMIATELVVLTIERGHPKPERNDDLLTYKSQLRRHRSSLGTRIRDCLHPRITIKQLNP